MRFPWVLMASVLLVAAGAEAQAPPEEPATTDPTVTVEAPDSAIEEEVAEDVEPAAEDEVSDASPTDDAPTGDAPTEAPAEAPPTEESPRVPRVEPPKVAIVVVGDPDDRLRGLARRVDEALEPELRRPFDPGLRSALRGELGESGDGLDEVRRDRRRLGANEAADAPLIASLGRRAGALVVGVVRADADGGAELVVLDVRHAAFYEGALPLDDTVAGARVVTFLHRRARAAAHVATITPESVAAQTPPDPEPEEPEEEEDEPDFFEQYWPYMVAALLLGGMITAIVVTQATEQTTVPVLRFVPGGG